MDQMASGVPGLLQRVGTKSTLAPEHRTLSGQQYADAVSNHAKQTAETSLFPGLHFENLAGYLQDGVNGKSKTPKTPTNGARPLHHAQNPDETFPFVTIYSLDGTDAGKQPTSYSSPDALPPIVNGKPMIVFLRGKPTSAWLPSLGAAYRIDPEFFNRHLDFRSTLGRPEYLSLSSLPSAQTLIFDLPYITIGQVKPNPRNVSQSVIDSMRLQASQRFDSYEQALRVMFSRNTHLGESIVRKFRVHDNVYTTLEQRVSVALNRTHNTWQLFIWLDTGKPLSQSPDRAPWLSPLDERQPQDKRRLTLTPIIRTHPLAALRSHKNRSISSRGKDEEPNRGPRASRSNKSRAVQDGLAQNISLLHNNYGHHLDPTTMAADPFYALSDIFHHVAAGYKQYLNMLEYKDMQRTVSGLSIEDDPFGFVQQNTEQWNSINLRYDQAALASHLPQLRNILEIIRRRIATARALQTRQAWPHPPQNTPQETIAAESAAALAHDFEELMSHADRLLKRYNDGVTLLMNRAVTAEAAKSVEQAKVVTKLTRLAFVYIPLNFTAAVFGMNLSELSHWGGPAGGLPSIWLFFAVSLPVLVVSLVLMTWDVALLWRRAIVWVCEAPYRRRREAEEDEKLA